MTLASLPGPAGLALVTGAGAGMGAATARQLAAQGWPLLLCDISAPAVAAVADETRAQVSTQTLAADIASPDFTERLGHTLADRRIGALVHCAGLSPSMAGAERIFEVNLTATLRLLDAIFPRLVDGAGLVLFASSSGYMVGSHFDEAICGALSPETAGSLVAHAPTPELAYAVSKRAVQLLVRAQARRFGQAGARLVSLSPGVIDTGMGQQEMAGKPVMAQMVANAALPRMGRPDEVAAVAVFLCSAAASFITGIDVLVDGGEIAGMPQRGAG